MSSTEAEHRGKRGSNNEQEKSSNHSDRKKSLQDKQKIAEQAMTSLCALATELLMLYRHKDPSKNIQTIRTMTENIIQNLQKNKTKDFDIAISLIEHIPKILDSIIIPLTIQIDMINDNPEIVDIVLMKKISVFLCATLQPLPYFSSK